MVSNLGALTLLVALSYQVVTINAADNNDMLAVEGVSSPDLSKVLDVLNKINQLKFRTHPIYSIVDPSGFVPPTQNESDSQQASYLYEKLRRIEQIIDELKKNQNNVNDVSSRMNELERELENIWKELDNKFKMNDAVTQSLIRTIKDLMERIFKLEEPERLKQLEKYLNLRDIKNATVYVNLIGDYDKIISEISKIFPKVMKHDDLTQSNTWDQVFTDLQFLLNFRVNITSSNLRLSLLKYVYNNLILTKNDIYAEPIKKNGQELVTKRKFMNNCNILKLHKTLSELLTHSQSEESSEINKLLLAMKDRLAHDDVLNDTRERLKRFYSPNFVIFEDALVTNSTVSFDYAENGIKQYEFGINIDNNLQCWYNIDLRLFDRMVEPWTAETKRNLQDTDRRLTDSVDTRLKNIAKIWTGPQAWVHDDVRDGKYADALFRLNQIGDTVTMVDDVIYYLYNTYDLDRILNLIDLVKEEKRQYLLYRAVFNAISKADFSNLCDMLKLIDRAPQNIRNDLKDYVSSLIKIYALWDDRSSPGVLFTYKITPTSYNNFTVYDKTSDSVTGILRFYSAKVGNNNYCYYNGKVSIDNYNNWKYTQYVAHFSSTDRVARWDYKVSYQKIVTTPTLELKHLFLYALTLKRNP